MDVNLQLKQGAVFLMPITWASNDDPPVRYDLTGASAAMQIRKGNAEGTVLVNLSSSDGITFPAPTQGQLLVTIDAADTVELPLGKHPFDLFVTLAGEQPVCILEGTIEVRRQITRA